MFLSRRRSLSLKAAEIQRNDAREVLEGDQRLFRSTVSCYSGHIYPPLLGSLVLAADGRGCGTGTPLGILRSSPQDRRQPLKPRAHERTWALCGPGWDCGTDPRNGIKITMFI